MVNKYIIILILYILKSYISAVGNELDSKIYFIVTYIVIS